MTTVHRTTDNVQTEHERVLSLTARLLQAASDQYPLLSRGARRELLHACADLAQTLAALGVRLSAQED